MAYDLEEQEQLDEFKAWWKLHGPKVVVLITTLVVVYLGYQGWHYYQDQQSLKASTQYENLLKLDITDAKNLKAIQSVSAQLMDKYSSTPYAGRAALTAAKANFQANEIKSAKSQLEWAANNAKEDAIQAMALLELASLQFEEKDYAGALKTLGKKHTSGFDGLFADLKGDVLVAQGKPADAKVAYKEALEKLDSQGRLLKFTQHKLEVLGN
jgi:predicted negative regulator of RcsB-dependent stress response